MIYYGIMFAVYTSVPCHEDLFYKGRSVAPSGYGTGLQVENAITLTDLWTSILHVSQVSGKYFQLLDAKKTRINFNEMVA